MQPKAQSYFVGRESNVINYSAGLAIQYGAEVKDGELICMGTYAAFVTDEMTIGSEFALKVTGEHLVIEAGKDSNSLQVVEQYNGEKYLHIYEKNNMGSEDVAIPEPPKTGDGANVTLWLGLALLSAAGVINLLKNKTRA